MCTVSPLTDSAFHYAELSHAGSVHMDFQHFSIFNFTVTFRAGTQGHELEYIW